MCRLVASLSSPLRACLVRCLETYSTARLLRLIETIQQFISVRLLQSTVVDEAVETAVLVLAVLYDASEGVVPYTAFYNDVICAAEYDLHADFMRWRQPARFNFSFCAFPFVLDPAAKAKLLQEESSRAMTTEFENAVLRSLFERSSCPYCFIKARLRTVHSARREQSAQRGISRRFGDHASLRTACGSCLAIATSCASR